MRSTAGPIWVDDERPTQDAFLARAKLSNAQLCVLSGWNFWYLVSAPWHPWPLMKLRFESVQDFLGQPASEEWEMVFTLERGGFITTDWDHDANKTPSLAALREVWSTAIFGDEHWRRDQSVCFMAQTWPFYTPEDVSLSVKTTEKRLDWTLSHPREKLQLFILASPECPRLNWLGLPRISRDPPERHDSISRPSYFRNRKLFLKMPQQPQEAVHVTLSAYRCSAVSHTKLETFKCGILC